MRTLILILALGSGITRLSAQHPDPSFYRAGELRIKRLFPGDSIKVDLDTLYLMNRFTFNMIASGWKNNTENLSFFENGLALYDQQISTDDRVYDRQQLLSQQQDAAFSLELAGMQKEMTDLHIQLQDAMTQLENARKGMDELQANLKAQRWHAARGKLLWGLGGLCTGMVLMIIFQ
jgi:hypothetical protein